MPTSGPMTTTNLNAVTEFLEAAGVDSVVHEHEPTYRATDTARAEGLPAQQIAKTIVLRDGEAWTLAVIPASHRLDVRKLREALGASRGLRFATEEEMGERFPSYEVGAVPPIGQVVPAEVIDGRLIDETSVAFLAGDHGHSVLIATDDLVRLARAKVADICED